MKFSAIRLTCFALISASESDVRRQLLSGTDANVTALDWPAEIELKASDRYRRDRRSPSAPASHADLIDFLDFREAYDLILRNKSRFDETLVESLRRVSALLNLVADIRNRVAHTRPMEIDDLPTTIDFCKSLSGRAPSKWPDTNATLEQLEADPSHVFNLTVSLPKDPLQEIQHNLPPVDFDETGLLGRRKELDRVKRAIAGPYPVISILGDGGLGKTALALKVAYELVDDTRSAFDVVVWVTAKSTTLSTTEIRNIGGAIEDSLGLIKAAAAELGGNPDANPIEELITYLATFRVLLVLDNMETVNDSRLREFLLDLPLGSKVLMTSRIGLGIEHPVKLEPLSDPDTEKLLQTLARRRNVRAILELSDSALASIVGRLNGHPLFAKWLVAGVESGRRPSELAVRSDLLLDFCMSNVYEQLDGGAVLILQSLQALPGPKSQAELAYLNEVSAEAVQAALLSLYATNFVILRQVSENEIESLYEISEFARTYLQRTRPVPSQFLRRMRARSEELRRTTRELAAQTRSIYDKESIASRGPVDAPVARMLILALQELAHGSSNEALRMSKEAQLLAPSYGEAYRIEGHIQVVRDDRHAALRAFETALELAPDSPSTHFHFGRFLLRDLQDATRAREVLQDGAKLDSESPELLLALAEAFAATGDVVACFDATRRVFAVTLGTTDRRRASRSALGVALRESESCLRGGNLSLGLQLLEEVLDIVSTLDRPDFDSVSVDLILALEDCAHRFGADSHQDPFMHRASLRLASGFGELANQVKQQEAPRLSGRVKTVDLERGFGFITPTSGRDLFFHRSDLLARNSWERLRKGTLVAFQAGVGDSRGPRAAKVRFID